ncbi:hypothetical protein C8Q73DRAFT_699561 [Cubamyces lactineus]|nr:hypothetical protein C8Q73DRAFT_699561 [Cubamyces lactineus]
MCILITPLALLSTTHLNPHERSLPSLRLPGLACQSSHPAPLLSRILPLLLHKPHRPALHSTIGRVPCEHLSMLSISHSGAAAQPLVLRPHASSQSPGTLASLIHILPSTISPTPGTELPSAVGTAPGTYAPTRFR